MPAHTFVHLVLSFIFSKFGLFTLFDSNKCVIQIVSSNVIADIHVSKTLQTSSKFCRKWAQIQDIFCYSIVWFLLGWYKVWTSAWELDTSKKLRFHFYSSRLIRALKLIVISTVSIYKSENLRFSLCFHWATQEPKMVKTLSVTLNVLFVSCHLNIQTYLTFWSVFWYELF